MKVILISSLVVLLSACGGGGSSSSSSAPPSTAQYPVDSAYSAVAQMNKNYNLTAILGSNTFNLQITYVPGAMSSFNGQPAYTATITSILSEDGVLITNNVQTEFFTISPYFPLGAINTNGQVTVDTNQTSLPVYATEGQSNLYDTTTTYTDNTRTTIYSIASSTWSLSPDTSTTAFSCINTVGTIIGVGATSESDCYQIDESGNVLSLQVFMLVNGATLAFQ
ncbi:MAG TPA: hypothetical protein VNI53_02315 [Gammaproteobacteria bacterium]|nr:hypothetical protein [Gammaproteobacteria bacterium]